MPAGRRTAPGRFSHLNLSPAARKAVARGGVRIEVVLRQGRARKVCVVCRGGCVGAGDGDRVRDWVKSFGGPADESEVLGSWKPRRRRRRGSVKGVVLGGG